MPVTENFENRSVFDAAYDKNMAAFLTGHCACTQWRIQEGAIRPCPPVQSDSLAINLFDIRPREVRPSIGCFFFALNKMLA